MSKYKEFEILLETEGLEFIPEHRLFAEHVGTGEGIRKKLDDANLNDFRFDYALPQQRILIEVQGSGHSHSHRSNQQRDWKKCNDAVMLGWSVVYFPAARVSKRPDVIIDELTLIIEGREKYAKEA